MRDPNTLRRLNWLWKHRHTHDDDDDCCAALPELRLQIETAADINQHTRGVQGELGTHTEGRTDPEGAQVSSLEFDLPEATVAGSALTLFVVTQHDGMVPTPDGWTEMWEVTREQDPCGFWGFKKIADAADESSLTDSIDVSPDDRIRWACFVGAAPSNVTFDGSSVEWENSGAYTTSHDQPAPTIFPTEDGLYHVLVVEGGNRGGDPPSGYEKMVESADGMVGARLVVGYQLVEITGSLAPGDWSSSGSNYGSYSTVIIPAGGTGTVASPDDIVTDHGELTGRDDDDHSQYLNEARHDALDAADHGSGAATDGQVLTADGSGGAAWEDSAAGGASAIDDLSDVTITGTPADNEVVAYDTGTSEFINQTAAEAGLATTSHASTHADGGADEVDAADLASGAATDGQVLTADGSGGAAWEDASGGGSTVTTGTVTVSNGNTTGTTTHGLGGLPTASHIQLTPRGTLGTASEYYVSAVSLTEITVTVDADPGVDVVFAWMHSGTLVAGDYSTEITGDSPVAYYRLGESSGTTAADEISTNDATYTESHTLGVTGAVGDADTAVDLTGGYVLIPDLSITGDWSVELWINPDALSNDTRIISLGTGTTRSLRIDSGNLEWWPGSGAWQSLGSHGMSTGNWYQLVLTHTPGTITGYIDGASLGTTSDTYNLFDATVRIGSEASTGHGEDFDGQVDEISVWDVELTAGQVANHYVAATS